MAEPGLLAKRVSQELGIPFLDLTPALSTSDDPAQKYFLLHWSVELNGFAGNAHLSREGHYEIGRRVAEWLATL